MSSLHVAVRAVRLIEAVLEADRRGAYRHCYRTGGNMNAEEHDMSNAESDLLQRIERGEQSKARDAQPAGGLQTAQVRTRAVLHDGDVVMAIETAIGDKVAQVLMPLPEFRNFLDRGRMQLVTAIEARNARAGGENGHARNATPAKASEDEGPATPRSATAKNRPMDDMLKQ